MTTDLRFPSNKDKEIDFSPSFTEREKKFLLRKKKGDPLDKYFLIFLVVLALSFLGFAVETVFVPKAHAESPKEYKLDESKESFCKTLNGPHAPIRIDLMDDVARICL